MSTYLLPHSQPPLEGISSWHKNFSSTSQSNLWTVISTVPPPQSKTITTFPHPSCSRTDVYASSLHWIEAPSGSRHNSRFWLLVESIISAWTAAFLMKSLCSSLQRAGTVSTHLIFAGTIFPTCSFNLLSACWLMKRRVCYTTFSRGISLPSIDLAFVCMWSRCILYWISLSLHSGINKQSLRPPQFQRIFESHSLRNPRTLAHPKRG